MTTKDNKVACADAALYTGDWQVVLNSIGSSGTSIIGVLKKITNVSETAIAARLFQAPSVLFDNVSEEIAQKTVDVLRQAGLECDLQTNDTLFTSGNADYEVALVIRDYSRIPSLLESITHLLGIDLHQARQMLYATPAVLLGQISANTVTALKNRFAPFGVEVDVSQPQNAKFDIFLGECSAEDKRRVIDTVTNLGYIPLLHDKQTPNPLLMTELSLSDTQKIWGPLRRTSLPVQVVNRDFQRFNLRLEKVKDTAGLRQFLVETAGMPERIIHKLLQRLPIVTHTNISFPELTQYMNIIHQLEGKATGELLAFQKFALAIDQIGDAKASSQLITALTNLKADDTKNCLDNALIKGPFTNPQAHWLQHELKQVGTQTQLILR